jgi:hypothetical protein
MKKGKMNSGFKKILVLFIVVYTSNLLISAFGQANKTLVFDVSHGQSYGNYVETYKSLLPDNSGTTIEVCTTEINNAILKGKYGLILLFPTKVLQETEKKAIVDYLRSGGSLLLVFDEEKRVSLNGIGVNDIIIPFNIKLTDDAPVRHNCGAIAEKSEICTEKRELPYSRGRSIEGGTVISRVYDEGNYVHCAYVKLPSGGKIIVMSDGMAALLLGGPEGVRFSGTGPADSKFWGKDSGIFMEEILAFLLKE